MEVSTIAKDQTFINDQIRAREVRLIGQNGDQLGIKTKAEAMELSLSVST